MQLWLFSSANIGETLLQLVTATTTYYLMLLTISDNEISSETSFLQRDVNAAEWIEGWEKDDENKNGHRSKIA